MASMVAVGVDVDVVSGAEWSVVLVAEGACLLCERAVEGPELMCVSCGAGFAAEVSR